MALEFPEVDHYSLLRYANKYLFDVEYEPVWILNSDEVQLKEYLQYYPAMPEPPKPPPPPPPRPGPMVLRVPMCCEDCEQRIDVHVKALAGVESVKCDWMSEKVTVLGAEKDPVAATHLLSECRKLFKKSEMWT